MTPRKGPTEYSNLFSTFHPFPRLPFEIRQMIWVAATFNGRIVYLQQIRKSEIRCQLREVWETSEDPVEFSYDPDCCCAPTALIPGRQRQTCNPALEIWPDSHPDSLWGDAVNAHHEAYPGPGCEHRIYHYCTGFTSPSQPPLLYVCREASKVASVTYSLAFGTKRNPPTTRFNFACDTLYIDWKEDDSTGMEVICKLLQPDIRKVKKLAFRYRLGADSLRQIIGIFENVKQITLVNEDTCREIGLGDDIVWTDPSYTWEILDTFCRKRYCPVLDEWVRVCERMSHPWLEKMDQVIRDVKSRPGKVNRIWLSNPIPDIQLKTLMTRRYSEQFQMGRARWHRDAKRKVAQRRCGHQQCEEY
jgi:hypothetical protein